MLGISRAGTLVAKTFDESLMSINYARAAAADFASMRAAFARRWIAVGPGDAHPARRERRRVAPLAERKTWRSLRNARSRSAPRAPPPTCSAPSQTGTTFACACIAGSEPDVNWDTLDHYTDIVEQQIDLLVNYTAGDAFLYRQTARSTVSREMYINLGLHPLALLISAAVAWLLARRIIGPVAAASDGRRADRRRQARRRNSAGQRR